MVMPVNAMATTRLSPAGGDQSPGASLDQFVLTGIGELVTMAPLAKSGRRTELTPPDLGRLGPEAWLAAAAGKIVAVGLGPVPESLDGWARLSAEGGLVLPGLVDMHTHALFAGAREHEFWQRGEGATYQQIAARGGGIQVSVSATRAASDASLHASLTARLTRMLRRGVTTVEVKTGYGLSVAAELRLLRLLTAVKAESPLTLSRTCLALHAASPEGLSNAAYVESCTEELLPRIAAEGLADAVDAFIEQGYFSVAEVAPYAARARELGLALRLHADEFNDVGAATAAAAWGAANADHLQQANLSALPALAAAGVTATLLPGTSLYTKIPFTQGRPYTQAGVPVAIATDFNPGSCQIDQLALLATVAAVQSGLTPVEVVAAVTYVPACALGMGRRKGALAPGYDADFAVYPLAGLEAWLADFGRTEPTQVWTAGTARL